MDDRFDERLHDRLSALDAAVPARGAGRPPQTRSAGSAAGSRRRRQAVSVGLAAALVLALVALVSAGLAARYFVATEPTGSPTAAASATTEATASVPATPTSEPTVIMGSEGFPVSIDGQPVYRLDDWGTWQNLSGSFLVAAGAPYGPPSCPVPFREATPVPTADADLLGPCSEVILFNTSGFASGSGGSGRGTAPKGLSLEAVMGWGGHIIVVRAHTHDPEAAQCSAAERAACEAALVVEAIVWPTVPDEIDGEHVFRGSDQLDGNLARLDRSFLFGGLVSVQATGQEYSECSASTAASQLLAYCTPNLTAIDGVEIAPNSAIEAMADQVVVVRAHDNDPLAADCPAAVRTGCEQSMVVESVVWSSKPYSTARSVPLPTPSGTPSLGSLTGGCGPHSIPGRCHGGQKCGGAVHGRPRARRLRDGLRDAVSRNAGAMAVSCRLRIRAKRLLQDRRRALRRPGLAQRCWPHHELADGQ